MGEIIGVLNSSGVMDGDGATVNTEAQYATAKISVWWDMDICRIPKGSDPHAIASNIRSVLVRMNYCGPFSISAYGDMHLIRASLHDALSSTSISLIHVPSGVKDGSDKKILVDMILHHLLMRKYNILLAQPQKASGPLVAAAKSVWLWTSLVAGGTPLSNAES